ncbi:restriction endonuclease subunit S [Streptomyces parvus]
MTLQRIKDVARINQHVLPESTDPNFRFRYIDIGAVDNIGNVTIPDDDSIFSSAPSRARRKALPGSVLVSTVRTYLRAIAVAPKHESPLVFSTGFAVLDAQPGVSGRFLGYHCRSQPFVDEVVARSTGVSYPAINASEIGNLPISLPPLKEQHRIADFLDAEISRIDALFDARRSQVTVLDERMESVREETFGGGAAGASPTRLMHLTDPYRPIVYGIVQAGPEFTQGIPYIKTGDLKKMDPASLSRTSPEIHAQFRRAAVHPGDIVIAMRASIGAIASVPAELPVANLTQGTARIAAAPGVDKDWLFQALKTRGVQEQCDLRAVGSTFRTLNIWDLRRITINAVPSARQKVVTRSFSALDRQHRMVRHAAQRQLTLLAERRQALITAAVTGQFDVSTASGRNVTDGV